MPLKFLTIIFWLISLPTFSQTLGGNSIFNFLKLPNAPSLSAMGGLNTSYDGNDIGLAFNQPALLKPAMHSQLNASFNAFYASTKAYHLSLGYHHPQTKTTFMYGVFFMNYGNAVETDASGNVYGEFNANDWVMQVSASRQYLDKWRYGSTIKFISSNYGQYKSNGIAIDVGLVFSDTAKLFTAGLLVKNMGKQLKKYNGAGGEDLPFDLQLGMTKKLPNAPFAFSMTLHHLHQFDIRYDDTVYNALNDFQQNGKGNFFFDKIFRHVVIASHIYLGKNVEATLGYNHLRRKELNIGREGNGLNGFSAGVGIKAGKFNFQYAHARYQNNSGYNQIGLTLHLNKLVNLN